MLTDAVKTKLREIVGTANFLDSLEDRIAYSYDATLYQAMPDVAVYPEHAEQVAAILRLANEEGFAVTPRGAGTGLSGGSIATRGGVVLVLTRMNRLLEINTGDLFAVAEPGVITAEFAAAAAKHGLLYPPDPASQAVSTLGGNVAENAGGLRGLKYGVTRNYILALDVVTPTGDRLHTGSMTVKCVTGYDLTQLFVGSEGTLGVATKIWCKLVPMPEHKETLRAVFSDMDDAARSVAAIIRAGVIPATLEFLDHVTINAIEDFKKIGLPREAEAILLIETDGQRDAARAEAAKVMDILRENHAQSVLTAANEAERAQLWAARRAALSSLTRVRPTTILEDATVPRSRIPDMVRGVREIGRRYNLIIGNFGHAGDGNLHPTILTDARDADEFARAEKATEEIFELALSLGGTLSGEHGIGMAKARFLKNEVGAAGLAAMRAIKRAFDPNNILNPGKMMLNANGE
ncbi:MAG: FAD-binding protein [Candidatus Sumerlaeia bacterium]|nr:FAD-binding protein [Candidatus Sumerlaeia bacterium]